MTDPREMLDGIAQRAECTQHLGGWERHNAAQCSEFTHQEAPKLVAALRAVLDLHPREMGSRYCAECETRFHPCPTIRAITVALSGAQ